MSLPEKLEPAYQAVLKRRKREDTPEARLEFMTNVAKSWGLNRQARRALGLRRRQRGLL